MKPRHLLSVVPLMLGMAMVAQNTSFRVSFTATKSSFIAECAVRL